MGRGALGALAALVALAMPACADDGDGGDLTWPPTQPESTADVVSTLRLCRESRVAVVPFGGGSGVCGAIHISAPLAY